MNGTTIYLLVLLIATNLYWFFFTEKLLRDWKASIDKCETMIDDLISKLRNSEEVISDLTDRLYTKGDHT